VNKHYADQAMQGAKNPEHVERMMKLMRAAETEEDFRTAVVLYLFDPSYERGDIAIAEGIVRREKGYA
jgi:hypothetical protein